MPLELRYIFGDRFCFVLAESGRLSEWQLDWIGNVFPLLHNNQPIRLQLLVYFNSILPISINTELQSLLVILFLCVGYITVTGPFRSRPCDSDSPTARPPTDVVYNSNDSLGWWLCIFVPFHSVIM